MSNLAPAEMAYAQLKMLEGVVEITLAAVIATAPDRAREILKTVLMHGGSTDESPEKDDSRLHQIAVYAHELQQQMFARVASKVDLLLGKAPGDFPPRKR